MTNVYRIIITPIAGNDLEVIHEYISRDTPRNADAMITRILDALESLRAFPFRPVLDGQKPRLRFPVRTLTVPPYRIYIRVLEEDMVVRVLHVRHSARRPRRRFES